MPISAEQCVTQLGDLLGQVPVDTYSEQALEWFADVAGTVGAYNAGEAIPFTILMPSISDTHAGLRSPVFAGNRERACTEFKMRARSLYRKLRLETNVFVTAQFEPGDVHDYFEEVRQLLSSATRDVLFIDPWINAEFAVRYLPQTPDGVVVRLLTARGQGAALRQALNLYAAQHGRNVELRVHPNGYLHDRHLVIDGADVYQSGASFKDGARNAPTSINQIVDLAAEMIEGHEGRWNRGQPVQ